MTDPYCSDLKTVSDTVLGRTYNLFYDALGRCVKRDLNGTTTTYYIYDGEKPIVEYNSSGTIIARTVYGKGIDEILMRKETGINDGNWFYYADDHEGSVTHLLDGRSTPTSQTGNVLEKYAYDAFGVPTFMDSNGNNLNPNATVYNNRFLFTGREYTATYRSTYVSTFSFYEYRARAYNPTLGRFMSEDPKLFDAGDYNLFRYCHNDPVDFTDPMGLEYQDLYEQDVREGGTARFEMKGSFQRTGKDLYGGLETRIGTEVRAVGSELYLTKFDVTVGKRIIATETRNWGDRNTRAIAATKVHEDKHAVQAKPLHDEYQKRLGTVVDHLHRDETLKDAGIRVNRQLSDEFNARQNLHEPKSEWRDIMKREDDGNTRHNFSYTQQLQLQQQAQQSQRFENPSTLYFIQIVH